VTLWVCAALSDADRAAGGLTAQLAGQIAELAVAGLAPYDQVGLMAGFQSLLVVAQVDAATAVLAGTPVRMQRVR